MEVGVEGRIENSTENLLDVSLGILQAHVISINAGNGTPMAPQIPQGQEAGPRLAEPTCIFIYSTTCPLVYC